MHTKSDGYHFPSAQQRCIVHPAGPQAAVFSAPGIQAAIAFFLPFAIESPAEPAIASAATAATRAIFDTIFIMETSPRCGVFRPQIAFQATGGAPNWQAARSGSICG
jgi:hypothetical protein